MIKETIEFRPRKLAWARHKALIFFACITVIAAFRMLIDPSSDLLVPLIGGAILSVAGLYLAAKGRFPGRPSLTVDAHGLTYRRGRDERSMAWSEVEDIVTDDFTQRMTFVSNAEGPSIHMHPDMVADDGREWSMLIEQFWQRPRA